MKMASWLTASMILLTLSDLSLRPVLCTPASNWPVWYVKASPKDHCPMEGVAPCSTLAEYINIITDFNITLAGHYIDHWLLPGSNTTFHFLPGRHIVNVEGIIAYAYGSNFSLTGSTALNSEPTRGPKASIHCTNNSGFLFVYDEMISISDLEIVGCRAQWSGNAFGLKFHEVKDLTISRVVVRDGVGYGVVFQTVLGIVEVSDSWFVNNSPSNGQLLMGGNAWFSWKYEDAVCLDMGANEFANVSIINSTFFGSSGDGLIFILYRACIAVHITLHSVKMASNRANLYVFIGESQFKTTSHHIAVQSCLIEGGFSSIRPGIDIFITTLLPEVSNLSCEPLHAQHYPNNSVTIMDTTISGNVAVAGTGGLSTTLDSCQAYRILLENVTLYNNTALPDTTTGGFAGNMAVNVLRLSSSHEIIIRNSKLLFGTCIGGAGGLFLFFSGSEENTTQLVTVRVYNTNFTANKGWVGGVYVISFTLPPTITLLDTVAVTSINNDKIFLTAHFNSCMFSANAGSNVAALSLFRFSTFAGFVQDLKYTEFLITKCVFNGHYIIPAARFQPNPALGISRDLSYIPPSGYSVASALGKVSLIIKDSRFVNNRCTSLSMDQIYVAPVIALIGSVEFIGNQAPLGAAISIPYFSLVVVMPNTSVHFANNTAEKYGGAIYFLDHIDNIMQLDIPCKLYPLIPAKTLLDAANIHLYFINNTAGIAGDAIYGGALDYCTQDFLLNYVGADPGSEIWNYSTSSVYSTILNHSQEHGISVVSSSPIGTCFCSAGLPDCSNKSKFVEVFPGETTNLSMVAVGQRNGVIPSTIYLSFVNEEHTPNQFLGPFQQAQNSLMKCTNVSVTVHSDQPAEAIVFSVSNPALTQASLSTIFKAPVLSVALLPCPPGFVLRGIRPQCGCESRLLEKKITCDINSQTVHRPQGFWLAYDSDKNGVLIHPHCPFHYCHHQAMDLHLASADDQCDFSRSGLLCGGCRKGFSLALGSSQCLKCSNSYLWLIAVFAAFGLILVFFLTFCNLTISEGTLTSIIFYANIVQFRKSIFLPSTDATYMFSVFIAWINLDLGIQTCFFERMDMYAKTWLQFVFPIYVWSIVLALVVLSRYHTGIAKIVGRNAPKVLATLFILSYTKLLKTVITIFSFTFLEYPDGTREALWLYDGNVVYLSGKHIPLFIAGILVSLFFLVPYTLLILFYHWLQKKSGHRLLIWVQRLKPFLDAYSGPYKDKCHYWPGLLLFCRVILFMSFAVNSSGDPHLDLLLTVVMGFALLGLKMIQRGVYRHWLANVTEISVLVNLITLAQSTSFVLSYGGNQDAVSDISAGIVFSQFVGITIYRIYVDRLRQCTALKRLLAGLHLGN